MPAGAAAVYAFFGYVPVDAEGGMANLTFMPIPEYDFDFYKEYLTGLAFVIATTLTFSYAIVGTQIFRGTILGGAWGLLLVGIALNTGADIYYYIFELFGDYVRANPITAIWVAGTMIVCYALYKHREDV